MLTIKIQIKYSSYLEQLLFFSPLKYQQCLYSLQCAEADEERTF